MMSGVVRNGGSAVDRDVPGLVGRPHRYRPERDVAPVEVVSQRVRTPWAIRKSSRRSRWMKCSIGGILDAGDHGCFDEPKVVGPGGLAARLGPSPGQPVVLPGPTHLRCGDCPLVGGLPEGSSISAPLGGLPSSPGRTAGVFVPQLVHGNS